MAIQSGHVQRFINIGILAALTLIALVSVYITNVHDYKIFRDAALAVLDGELPYTVTGYFNPPHTILWVAPFTIGGHDWLAFFNIVAILLVVVGTERHPATTAVIALIVLLTPQLVFVAAAVNIPGITTGIALVLLLRDARGVLRGLSWALLLSRPQDAILVAAYDGWRAWQQRDVRAFVSAAVMLLPTVLLLPIWLENLPTESPTGLTLSPVVNVGLLPTVVFFAAMILLRLRVRPSIEAVVNLPCVDKLWLLILATQLFQPYLVYYVLWMHLLLIRVMPLWRVVVFAILNIVIFATFATSIAEETSGTIGAMLTIAVIGVLAPIGYRRESGLPTAS